MPEPLLIGRTDVEAASHIENMLIAACEGFAKTNEEDDKNFRQFRRQIRGRKDLTTLVPRPVLECRDLAAFWDYIKRFDPQWAPRRAHIREEFTPLADRLDEYASGAIIPPIDSARWTGRRSPAVQARVVRALVPDAILGVDELIERLEAPLHNGGPYDPRTDDALAQLRLLHGELSELLRLVDHGNIADDALGRLRSLRRTIFQWSAETYGLTVAGLPLATSSTVVACGVMGLLNVLTKGSVGVGDAATIAAVTAGAHGAGALAKKRS